MSFLDEDIVAVFERIFHRATSKHTFDLPDGAAFQTVSPDSTRLAYGVPDRKGAHVAVNGQRGRSFDTVAGITFSKDSRHVAYAAMRGGQWCAVFNDREYELWDEIGVTSPVISPDGLHVAYSARRGRHWFVVKDGMTVGGPYNGIVPGGIVFSPDSQRMAYGVIDNGGQCLVTDGIPAQVFCCLMTGTWTFSPDSKVVAYVAGVSGASRDHVFVGESAVVMNSDVLQAWPHDGNKGLGVGAEVYFSPNSKRHAYTVAHESGGVIVVDGTRGPGYDEKVGAFREFPKCQDYLGYGKAGWKDHGVEFSPDSDHYAYAARNEKNATVFLDGEPHWTGERILSSGMLFSNDAQRLAFGAEAEDGSQFMVVDRVPQKRFYGLPPSRKSFSPDSRRIAYFASDGRSTLLVIDSEVRRVPGVIPAGSRILWDGPEQLHTLVARGRSISLTRFAVGSGD